jgi:hypothetical protein
MPTKKVVAKPVEKKQEENKNLCQDCLKRGKKVELRKGQDNTVECPQCFAWRRQDPVESKEDKKKRLLEEMKAREAELKRLEEEN